MNPERSNIRCDLYVKRHESSAARWRSPVGALAVLGLLAACGGAPADGTPDDLMGGGAATEQDDLPPIERVEIVGGPKVVVLGDSISAGLHLAAERAYPAVIQRQLAKEGLPFQLVNAGVSGDTTASGLSRVDWILKSNPDIVVVALGGNDLLRGQPAASAEANLRKILDRLRAAGTRILLLGYRLPPNFGELTAEYDGLYPRLAKEYGLPFVPFFMEGVAGIPDMNLPDQLHPTAAGHEVIAGNVAPALRDLVQATD